MYLYFLILFSLQTRILVNGARILGIFPVNSRSHHSINQPILKGLTARGHHVTIISHFESKSKLQNYTEILLDDGLDSFIDSIPINKTRDFVGLWNWLRSGDEFESRGCLKILHHDYIQRLIHSKEKTVDLMFVEMYYTQCYTLLAYKLNVSIIAVQPPGINSGLDYMIGNPFNPSYVPFVFNFFTTNMNFWQRLSNTIQYVITYLHHQFVFNRDIKRIAANVLNVDYPSEEALNKRVALAFYNNHFSFLNRPMVPNAIDIAGIHINEAEKLPQEVQEFIDGAIHGVIFFSFGTTIKGSSMDAKKISSIVKVFSTLPQRILWRVDDLNIIDDIPSNVKLSTWFPQRDILEHKNVIAFISHCGLLGSLEALHTGTPVIGIPFLYDQFQNIEVLVERGVGIYLNYHSMDTSSLQLAINEIISNKKYRENMSKLSQIFKDRPLSAKDNAIFWSEYVIKHDGAPHLRSHAADMPWFSYLLLDVILVIVVGLIFILYACKLALKLIVSLVYSDTKCKVE